MVEGLSHLVEKSILHQASAHSFPYVLFPRCSVCPCGGGRPMDSSHKTESSGSVWKFRQDNFMPLSLIFLCYLESDSISTKYCLTRFYLWYPTKTVIVFSNSPYIFREYKRFLNSFENAIASMVLSDLRLLTFWKYCLQLIIGPPNCPWVLVNSNLTFWKIIF